MKATVKINQLTYKKNLKTILADVSLDVSGDKIIGILGENGAGKTTLFRIISGVAKNYRGDVAINGKTSPADRKSLVSYSQSLGGFPENKRISQVANFHEQIYPDFDRDKYNQMIDFLSLDVTQRLAALSKGTKEKVIVALTLARKTSVYLLDEPFGGIDSMSRKKIINSIIQWKPTDSLMLISDHYVSEIASILDEIVVLKDHTVAIHKRADDVRQESGKSIEDYYESLYEEGAQK
ncbi:ATP-binding cassette domain-containing protein [Secundilactobacillus folii]|uniref:ATP-binding cassette domain-containing protein n=1 Tax=Secundilactobacillus folii TaxID=2678357 RepID=A0A7X2XVD0_9LACO|nr:ATP-binding cassette domain-containing protein [Secundilactobacillus folii]MTV82308.1 ATP-binding cassette domain-containing protein [Secundilactobacillus folii]